MDTVYICTHLDTRKVAGTLDFSSSDNLALELRVEALNESEALEALTYVLIAELGVFSLAEVGAQLEDLSDDADRDHGEITHICAALRYTDPDGRQALTQALLKDAANGSYNEREVLSAAIDCVGSVGIDEIRTTMGKAVLAIARRFECGEASIQEDSLMIGDSRVASFTSPTIGALISWLRDLPRWG